MTSVMVLLSAGVAAVPIGVCYFGRWILDRTRTEPPWMFPILIVLGGLGGCIFALFIAPRLSASFILKQDQLGMVDWTTILQAASEEVGKVMVLCPVRSISVLAVL